MLGIIWNLFNGKKSYLTALVTLVFAFSSVYLGQMTLEQAAPYVLGALSLVSVKSALTKVGK